MQNKNDSLGKGISLMQRKLVFISKQWKRNAQQIKIAFFQSTFSFLPPYLPGCTHSPYAISSKSSQISSKSFIISLCDPCPLFFNISLGLILGREMTAFPSSPLWQEINVFLFFGFVVCLFVLVFVFFVISFNIFSIAPFKIGLFIFPQNSYVELLTSKCADISRRKSWGSD